MALFVWKCGSCGAVTKRLLSKRPELTTCSENGQSIQTELGPMLVDGPCGGTLEFVTNTSSQTMEVIDNGLMARRLERPVNIEEKLAQRNAHAEKPDDPIV